MNEQINEGLFKEADKKVKLSAWQVLRYKFPASEYVLIEEVSDASGFSRSRSLDYMLINLWNSRGLAVTGIEMKSNRSDWLKELKSPEKQENHFKHCDYFYLLTDKDGVAKLEEIPINWGWYHINGSQILKTVKAAPKLNAEPIGRSLMCAMLRRAADKEKYVHIDSIKDKIEERSQVKTEQRNYEVERKAKQYDELRQQVNEFEESSGIKIASRWGSDSKKIGEAVRIINDHGIDEYLQSLKRIENQIRNIHEGIVKNIELLNNEQKDERSVATGMPWKRDAGKQKLNNQSK